MFPIPLDLVRHFADLTNALGIQVDFNQTLGVEQACQQLRRGLEMEDRHFRAPAFLPYPTVRVPGWRNPEAVGPHRLNPIG